jgi:ketosteroid isomerase-like protein
MANVAVYRGTHDAFNRRDWDALADVLADELEYVDEARAVTLKGPGEYVDYLKTNWVGAFSDASVTRATYHDAGDSVIAQFLGTGTNDGPVGPAQATGRGIRVPFCEVVRFDTAGRIVAGRLYYDQVTMLVQLGLLDLTA